MTFAFNVGSTKVNTEVTGTFTFKDDDVAAVYIDWDDGVDNKENANYQWVQFDRPLTTDTVTHTYNATGTYKPIIRTISSKGYVSRYYSADSIAPTGVAPWSNGNMDSLGVSDGTPVGSLRIQNKEMLSGIDNTLFDRPKDIYLMFPPTETSYGNFQAAFKITAEVVNVGELATGSNYQMGGSIETRELEIAAIDVEAQRGRTKINTDGTLIRSIKKVVLSNPKLIPATYAQEKASNALKCFLITSGSDGLYYPITYVSTGAPIKYANDSRRTFTADFSQSRAAASNTSVDTYYYDLGKSWFNPVDNWTYTSTPPTQRIATPSGTATTQQSTFTYMPRPEGLNYIGQGAVDSNADYVTAFGSGTNYPSILTTANEPISDQFPLTDTNQLFDQYRLIRNNIKTNTTKYTYTKAFNGVFRICPAEKWNTGAQDPLVGLPKSITKLYEKMGTLTSAGVPLYSSDLTIPAYSNLSGTYTTAGAATASGMVSMNDWNGVAFKDRMGNPRKASEYFFLISDTKFDKVFFNCSPYSPKLQSDLANLTSGTTIVGVQYLKVSDYDTPKCEMNWEPLEFSDTTRTEKEYRDTSNKTYVTRGNSLSKSGLIEFQEPDDWQPITFNDVLGTLSGTQWGSSEGGGVLPVVGNTSPYELPVTATCIATGTGQNGKWAKFNTITGFSGYSADDIGRYKYGAILSSGTMLSGTVYGQFFWVASGASGAGYDGTNMYLQIGDLQYDSSPQVQYGSFNPSTVYTFKVRRINAWEVFDGAQKVWGDSPTGPGGGNLQIPNLADGVPWPNLYCFATGSQVGEGLKNKWGDTESYVLKVSVSGSYFPSGSGATSRVGPEIWNILPAGGSTNQVVREIDDHAYSLCKLPLTSDMSVNRSATYFQSITRKGKVYILRTGTPLANIGFTSVALGDESNADAFTDYGSPSDTYGQLRTIRNLQANGRRAYWDFEQKDGTFVRFVGVLNNIEENRGVGSPRAIMNYSFEMMIEEIALLDANGLLMTDFFPIGGLEDARSYT